MSLTGLFQLVISSQNIFVLYFSLYKCIYIKVVYCSTVAHSLVALVQVKVCFFLSIPSSSVFLHIQYFFPHLPTHVHSWGLHAPTLSCSAAAGVSLSPQPAPAAWAILCCEQAGIFGTAQDAAGECTASKLVLIFHLKGCVGCCFFSFKRVLFSQPSFNQCICSLHVLYKLVLSAVGTACGVEAAKVGGKHREEAQCWLTFPLPLDVLSVLICGVSFFGKTRGGGSSGKLKCHSSNLRTTSIHQARKQLCN